MKIALKVIISGCMCLAIMSMVVGYIMFDYRASGLVLVGIFSTIGIFNGFASLDDISNAERTDSENDGKAE